MDAKEVIVAQAVANAELMAERDSLRNLVNELDAERNTLRSKIEALEEVQEDSEPE